MNPEIITVKDTYGDGFVRVYHNRCRNKYCLVVDTEGRIKNMGVFDEAEIKLELVHMLEKWNWEVMMPYWKVDKGESILYDHWGLMATDDTDALIMW